MGRAGKGGGLNVRKRGVEPINLLFGLLMGTADIIPGVSGGTVALIVGIYERLIASVRAVATGAASLVRGRVVEARRMVGEVEWGFLLPLGFGIVTALVVGARVLEPLLERYPVESRALFFGLIAASVVVPWHRMEARSHVHVGAVAIAAVAAFIIVGLPPREIEDPTLLIVFFAASVAICAMILPGVSGSFLLLVLGLYETTIGALNALNFTYILVFVAGAAVGLGVFSKVLYYLLRTHHDHTMAALVGLMLGSLRALWPYQDETRRLLGPPSTESFLQVLVLAVAGFALIMMLIRVGRKIEEKDRLGAPSSS
jgi:putative membrane protein